MPNRNLTPDELKKANALLASVREALEALSGGDPELLFAYRRKVFKELTYDERGKPMARKALKMLKWGLQERKCAHCGEEMPLAYSELDRKVASAGYTVENTELVHGECHIARQKAKAYT